MRPTMILLATLFYGGSAAAAAQQSEPTPVTTSGESAPYDSAFVDYRPMQEIKMARTLEDWRAANDTVARIGGHTGVLKDEQSMAAPPRSTAGPASTPSQKPLVVPGKPSSHQGH